MIEIHYMRVGGFSVFFSSVIAQLTKTEQRT